MSIIPHPADVDTHPSWCDPFACRLDDHGEYVRHAALPISWLACDVLISTALERDDTLPDDLASGGEAGVRLALLDLGSTAADGADIAADVFLRPDEARRLAQVLTELSDQADHRATGGHR